MLYHRLTVEQLRDIARRYGVSPTGTKGILIERLQAFERDATTDSEDNDDNHEFVDADDSADYDDMAAPPTTPAAIWAMYSDAQIDNMIAGQGFDMTNLITKADKITALATIPGLTPSNAIAAYQAMPRAQPPKVVTTLDKQASSEPIDQFLARVRTHFELIPHSNDQAVNALINAAGDKLRTYIHAQRQGGVQDIATLLSRIQDKYTPTAYQYYDMYAAYKMPTGHTPQEAGTDLRRLYIQFLGYGPADVLTHEPVITKALAARLLQVLPATTSALLRAFLLENPDKTWDEILNKANQLTPATTKTKASPTGNTRGSGKYCSVHGYRGHTDAECYAQNGGPPPDKGQQKKTSVTKCYACYKPGHTARDCPNAPQGNASTGSP
ncbi:MAG: hypothetical protein NHG36_10420 [Chromatiaceae bacterium]|nr:hypothetical protein [Candidatus Thioaporhodococcus sediminis]